MAFFGGSAGATNPLGGSNTTDKDVEVSDPPSDSISSLSFSSAGEFMAVGSLNNEVRLNVQYYIVAQFTNYLSFFRSVSMK